MDLDYIFRRRRRHLFVADWGSGFLSLFSSNDTKFLKKVVVEFQYFYHFLWSDRTYVGGKEIFLRIAHNLKKRMNDTSIN